MARGSGQATAAATNAGNLSNSENAEAQQLYGTLAPELESQIAHPTGFDPTTIAQMDTASQQSAGGSAAGAVGQGALLSARTRNAGGADAAIEKSQRNASQQLSSDTLRTRIQNAMLQNQNRQSAIGDLSGLYNTATGATLGASGQIANDVNANTNAANQSWDWAKYILDPAMSAAGNSKYV